MTCNLYQGLVVHPSGRFVADVEIEGGIVKALRLSETAGNGGNRSSDLTGKIVFPGPLMLCLDGMESRDSMPPATTLAAIIAGGIKEPLLSKTPAMAVDVLPIPLLRDPVLELDELPSLVFGEGYTAFAANDDTFDSGLRDDSVTSIVRVLGHCGATLVVLSNSAKIIRQSIESFSLLADGCRVLISPSNKQGMMEAISIAESCGAPGNRIGVTVPARLLLDSYEEGIEWWREVRRGFIQAVSVDQKSMDLGAQLLACLWRAGVKTGFVSLEELSSLVCWQPAKMFGLNQKGRLYPGNDADIAIIDPEICSDHSGSSVQEIDCESSSGIVTNLLRSGVAAASKSGRWVGGTPIREPI